MSRKIETRWFIDDDRNCIHVNSATFYGETLDAAVSEAIDKLKETLYVLGTDKIFANFYNERNVRFDSAIIESHTVHRLH